MEDRHPSRYITAQGLEAQAEPGSRGRVLRNRLGLRSKRQMDQVEDYDALTDFFREAIERRLREMRADRRAF